MEFSLLLPQVKFVAKIKALPLEHSTTYSNPPSPIHTLHYTQTKAGLLFTVAPLFGKVSGRPEVT